MDDCASIPWGQSTFINFVNFAYPALRAHVTAVRNLGISSENPAITDYNKFKEFIAASNTLYLKWEGAHTLHSSLHSILSALSLCYQHVIKMLSLRYQHLVTLYSSFLQLHRRPWSPFQLLQLLPANPAPSALLGRLGKLLLLLRWTVTLREALTSS